MKVDKGFELIYWNLSNRRKFIRTLWTLPIGILAGILLFSLVALEIIPVIIKVGYVIVFAVAEAIQLLYTYNRYRKEKEEQMNRVL